MMTERYIIQNNQIYDTIKERYININDISLIENMCRRLNFMENIRIEAEGE